jgi:hypothetical protein
MSILARMEGLTLGPFLRTGVWIGFVDKGP